MSAEEKKHEEEKTSEEGKIIALLKNWVFYVAMAGMAGISGYLGNKLFDKEKLDLYYENKQLKADTMHLGMRVRSLKEDSLDCIATVKKLTQVNKEKSDSIDAPDAKGENPNNTSNKTGKNTGAKDSGKKRIEPDERIDDLLGKLNYFETQNKQLIGENDTLKSSIYLMRQQVNRAKELEKQRKAETDESKKALIDQQIDGILTKVEDQLKKLSPGIEPPTQVPPKVDTVTVTIIDYGGLGDDSYNKAADMDEKLRTQPDSYFLGLKKNKTKDDFIQITYDSYKTAFNYYKQAGDTDKANLADKKMKDFLQRYPTKIRQ